jgi:multimeric flavodoxin WrbA
MSIISILGSSNSHGNTRQLLDACLSACGGDLIDLNEVDLSPWDYEGRNMDDGFASNAQRMVDSTDIIFATPVYWYAMSSQMKTFFDRASDLITRRKELGRALAGKRTWLLATGSEDELPEGFEVPFARTSDYFGMIYSGALYQQVHNDQLIPESLQLAEHFGKQIKGKIE